MHERNKESLLKQICVSTGYHLAESTQRVAEMERFGISHEDYLKFECWKLGNTELEEIRDVLIKLKKYQAANVDWYIELAHKRTLRSKYKLRKEMEMLEPFGVSPYKYMKDALYYPTRASKKLNDLKREGKPKRFKRNEYVWKICKETGWSVSKVEVEVAKAKYTNGADYKDYYSLRMFEASEKEQSSYVTRDLFNKMMLKYNQYLGRHLLNEKSVCSSILSPYIQRKWFVNKHLSYNAFLQKIDGLNAVIIKPLKETQGKGIRKIQCNVEDKYALYNEILSLPPSIVEEYVVQHDAMMEFCDTSVNTIRVVTLNANNKCNILHAVFRIGQGKVVDNFHAGGIAALVDVKTGIVTTHAVDVDGNIHLISQYSGLAMKGFQIPHWDKLLGVCQQCYNKIPGARLIGWDFAITPKGVELIEGNAAPSHLVAQVPELQLQKGLRTTMIDPYL